MKTIPFSIEAASKPGAKVVTRDGRKVLSWAHVPSTTECPVVAHIEGDDVVTTYTIDGFFSRCRKTDRDLLIAVEPKLRPWKDRSEVPLNAWFRLVRGEEWDRIVAVSNKAVRIGEDWLAFDTIFITREHSLDNGKTWLPCGVEE
jgi:hypothetical protein